MVNGEVNLTRVRVAGLSDIGVVREENQDSLLIREPADDETLGSRGILLAVADGMGGLQCGKIASRLAIDTLGESYYGKPGDPAAVLAESVEEANRVIHQYSREQAGGQSMGSTVTALAVLRDYAYIANVGDSRAYRYRDGEIRQITSDHSLYRELQSRGELGDELEDIGLFHMHRNVLTRGLGLREGVEVDLFELNDIGDGDTLILTSDGLHGLVDDVEFAEAIESHGDDLDGLCRSLVEKARERGGPDNITMVVASLGSRDKAGAGVSRTALEDKRALNGRHEGSRPAAWFLPLALLLAFLAGMGATLLLEKWPVGPLQNAGTQGSGGDGELREELRSLLKSDLEVEEFRRRIEEILRQKGSEEDR